MFTKSQREKLNELSELLYGSASGWQKELARGNFNIPTGFKEVTEKVDTVQFGRTKEGKPGKIMRRANALAKGLINPEQVPEERVQKIQEYRSPTFEELTDALEKVIDSQRLGHMPKEEMIQVLAYRYATGTLGFKVSLVRNDTGAYQRSVDEVLQTIPEDKRQALQDLIVTEVKSVDGLPVDAFQFISDVGMALNHPVHAEAMAKDSLQAVDLSRKPKVPSKFASTAVLKEASSFSAAEKRRRRDKNRAQRRARRVNRSA